VDVVLKHFAGAVEMSIVDDGQGIDRARVEDSRSLGIVGMRERVRALGGQLEITGRPGGGTSIHVAIPS
jgi:signal transduction histidine kinase